MGGTEGAATVEPAVGEGVAVEHASPEGPSEGVAAEWGTSAHRDAQQEPTGEEPASEGTTPQEWAAGERAPDTPTEAIGSEAVGHIGGGEAGGVGVEARQVADHLNDQQASDQQHDHHSGVDQPSDARPPADQAGDHSFSDQPASDQPVADQPTVDALSPPVPDHAHPMQSDDSPTFGTAGSTDPAGSTVGSETTAGPEEAPETAHTEQDGHTPPDSASASPGGAHEPQAAAGAGAEGGDAAGVLTADQLSNDDDLTTLRRDAAQKVADNLAALGSQLWSMGVRTAALDTEGVALATQMAGQLGQGTAHCFEQRQWYAGNTLIRQLVEVHYLLAHFADDPLQIQRWMRATPNRVAHAFALHVMRPVKGFLESEYRAHRSWGYHPCPSGGWLLPAHQPMLNPELLWLDLIQHLADVTAAIFDCVRVLRECREISTACHDVFNDLAHTINSWHAADPAADQVVVSDIS